MTTNKTLIAIDPEDFRAILKEELQAIITPPQQMEDTWLTLKETCQYLSVSKPTLYRMRLNGILKGKVLGRRVLFRRSELDAVLSKS